MSQMNSEETKIYDEEYDLKIYFGAIYLNWKSELIQFILNFFHQVHFFLLHELKIRKNQQ